MSLTLPSGRGAHHTPYSSLAPARASTSEPGQASDAGTEAGTIGVAGPNAARPSAPIVSASPAESATRPSTHSTGPGAHASAASARHAAPRTDRAPARRVNG